MIKSFFSYLKNIFSSNDEKTYSENKPSKLIKITPVTQKPSQRLESHVYNYLNSLNQDDVNLFWNLYIPYKSYNETTYMEVDLIATTSHGIFVFECKDYNADISGDISLQNWTAKYTNDQSHSMANPIYQNNQHINVLSKFLSIPQSNFISIVIMKFKSIKVDLGNNLLFLDDKYLNHKLKLALKINTSNFEYDKLNLINSKLLKTMNPDESIKEKHRLRIQTKFNS